MEMSYLEILDTAIKIGLGTLISGVTTWKVTRLQHKNEDEKERNRRRIDNLEKVASQTQMFCHDAMIYWSRIVDYTRKQETSQALSESQLRDLKEARTKLYSSYENLTSAESTLYLLGLKDSQERLRILGDAVSQFYAEVFIGEHGKSLEVVKRWRADILANRELFFNNLHKAYTK